MVAIRFRGRVSSATLDEPLVPSNAETAESAAEAPRSLMVEH